MKRRRNDFREKIKKIIFEGNFTKVLLVIGIIFGAMTAYIILNTPYLPSEEEKESYLAIAECVSNNDLDGAKIKIDNLENNVEVKIDSSRLIFKEKWSIKYETVIFYNEEPMKLELIQRSEMYINILLFCTIIGLFIGLIISWIIQAILVLILLIHLIYEGIKILLKKITASNKKEK